MICKNCGAKNSDTRDRCFNCGAQLNIETDTVKNEVKKIIPDISETVSVSDISDTVISGFPAQANDDEPVKLKKRETAELKKSANKSSRGTADRVKKNNSKKSKKAPRGKSNAGINFLIAVLCVVFVAVLGGLVFMIVKPDNSSEGNGTGISKINLASPEITKLTDSNGKEYLHGVFNGKIGDRLYLECNNSYHTFAEETVTVDLYLEDLFPADHLFVESSANANIGAYIIRENKRYACGTPTFSLSVPKAEYQFILPDSQSYEVFNDKFTIRLWTLPGSTVSLNGRDVTDSMTGLGLLQTEVEIKEGAKDTYKLQINQPYHTPVNDAFLLYRGLSTVDLSVAAYGTGIVSGNTVTISGSTSEGVEISCINLPVLSVEKNELYNTFTAKLDLSNTPYGLVIAKIQATGAEGTTTRSYTFWYWPDERSVTTTAKSFTEAVAENPAAYSGTYVLRDVTVEKVIGAGKFIGKITVGATDYRYIFSCDYDRGNVVVGSSYKIFAAYSSTDSSTSMPVFRAWYIY